MDKVSALQPRERGSNHTRVATMIFKVGNCVKRLFTMHGSTEDPGSFIVENDINFTFVSSSVNMFNKFYF